MTKPTNQWDEESPLPKGRLAFTDPVGPGTPAWIAYDKAVAMWRHYRKQSLRRAYKAYYNHRDYMIRCLVQAGQTQAQIDHWVNALNIEREKESSDD